SSSVCLNKTPPPLYSTFIPESAQAKVMKDPEVRMLATSKLSNQYLRGWVWKESEPETSKP
ncbi:hypothetical protein A2U01_0078946, partial [Trifolium medium]|nr:hypothetical protein [Trifolium medium]